MAILVVCGVVYMIIVVEPIKELWPRQIAFFNLDGEGTLPAWFSSMMMAGASVLMVFAGRAARLRDPANARPWLALAIVFLIMCIDESVSLHEKLGPMIDPTRHFTGIFRFAWVVGAAPLILAAIIGFAPFLKRLPSPIGRRMLVAGIVYVTGAFGFEMIGGSVYTPAPTPVIYKLCVLTEESLEMAGLILLLSAILDYLWMIAPTLKIQIRE